MKLNTVKRKYGEYVKLRGYAVSTITNKAHTLDLLFDYLKRKGIEDIEELDEKLVKRFVKERYYHLNAKGKQNAAKTQNREISVVSVFLSWMFEMGYVKAPLHGMVQSVKQSKVVLPKDILTKRELLKIFKQADTSTESGYRDRTMLELLYATGMRRSEVAGLKTRSVNYKEKTIHIEKGKGQKDRVVPVNEAAMTYLNQYVKYIRPRQLKPTKWALGSEESSHQTDALFISDSGKAYTGENLWQSLKKYIERAKLKKKVGLHSFRHTVATHLLQKGMPLRHVQELLGHEGLESTVKYLQLSIKDLQREYRKRHPREKDV